MPVLLRRFAHRLLALVAMVAMAVSSLGAADETPFFGIVPDQNAAATSEGLVLGQVVPRSAAELSGLRAGDVLTTFAGKPVKTIDDLRAAMEGKKVGEEIEVGFLRAGKQRTGTGKLTAYPGREAASGNTSQKLDDLTRKVESLEQMIRQKLGMGAGPGGPVSPEVAQLATAEAIKQLSKTLETFPGTAQKLAEEWKKQYPNGEFTIKIEVTITTDKNAPAPIDISPKPAGEAPTPKTPEASAPPAPTPVPAPAVP